MQDVKILCVVAMVIGAALISLPIITQSGTYIMVSILFTGLTLLWVGAFAYWYVVISEGRTTKILGNSSIRKIVDE